MTSTLVQNTRCPSRQW